jgi:outer membrane protein
MAMGRSGIMAEKDDVALKVYKAYMDLAYCLGAIDHTSKKRDESLALLHQTEVMAEVGQKSDADVAQMRATLAADEYELTHMQSQTIKARLALQQIMNFPADSTLYIVQPSFHTEPAVTENPAQISEYAAMTNPRIVKAQQAIEAARFNLRAARGALLPSLALSGGVSTSYYKNLNNGVHASFFSQFKNNTGEYVALSLSIPLFSQLSTSSTIRRRKIALSQARENLEYEQSELHRIIVEASADVDNSTKEVFKMQEQVEADSLAAHLTTRKYEEGLARFQSLCHLVIHWVLACYANVASVGLIARTVEHEYPVAASGLEKCAAWDECGLRRLAESQLYIISLSAAHLFGVE